MYLFKFLGLSIIGLLAFLAPITIGEDSTILIGHIKNIMVRNYNDALQLLIIIFSLITLVGTVIGYFKKGFKQPYLNDLFVTNFLNTVLRVGGAIFFLLVSFNIAPDFLSNKDAGGLMANDLIPSLMVTFFVGVMLMPLLTSYGLVEFVGTLIYPVMKKFFKLPGYAAIDALASFVGDGTIGIVVTDQQYQKGYYTQREAAIIATSFSIVGISFAAVVADMLKFSHIFGIFYLTIAVSTIIAGFVIARLPLKKFKDQYFNGKEVKPEAEVSFAHALKLAEEAVRKASDLTILKKSLYNVLLIYVTFIPVIMCVGSIGLIVAEETEFFNIISMPLIPVLEWCGYAKNIATKMAPAMIVGLSDMYLPAILIEKVNSESARFVIGTLSFAQLIFFSETGVMLLNTKLGFNIWDVVKFFIIRTLITFPIILGIAKILVTFGVLAQ